MSNLTGLILGTLVLDHKNKKEIDSMTARWLEQLTSLTHKHGEDISNIHDQAEKSLVKDYLVNGITPSLTLCIFWIK